MPSWNSSPYSNSNLEAYYTFGKYNENPADSGTCGFMIEAQAMIMILQFSNGTAPFAGYTITKNGASLFFYTKSVYGGPSNVL